MLLEHDLEIAGRLGLRAILLLVELDGFDNIESRENRELILLDLAETIRELMPQAALIGRTAEYEFAFLLLEAEDRGAPEERLREIIERWTSGSGEAISACIASAGGITSAENLFASAKARLCETRAYPLIG